MPRDLVDEAATAMHQIAKRAFAKHRAWQDAENPEFSEALWQEKMLLFKEEAFHEIEHPFTSWEHLREFFALARIRSRDVMLERIRRLQEEEGA
jgi:hypothetical protein